MRPILIFLSILASQNTLAISKIRTLSAETFINMLENTAPDANDSWIENEKAVDRLGYLALDKVFHYADTKLREGFASNTTLSGRPWEAYLNIAVRSKHRLSSFTEPKDLESFLPHNATATMTAYLCHGHGLLRLMSPQGKKILIGYYPEEKIAFARYRSVNGLIKDESGYYTEEILENCQRLIVPISDEQYKKLQDHIASYESQRPFHFAMNSCIDFVQSCFDIVYPDRGFFSCYMKDISIFSYNGSFDKAAAGSKLYGKGLFASLATIAKELLLARTPNIEPTIWFGQILEECQGRGDFKKSLRS